MAEDILHRNNQVSFLWLTSSELNDELQNREDEEDAAAAEMMVIERPRNWSHLIKTLFTVDEYKLLKLQNADGYFYLLYLKYSAILFGISNLNIV